MSLFDRNKTDPNKILPIKYKWAREYYKMGVSNNWTPEEVPMQDDVEQWKSDTYLSAQERKMILYNLGFFSTAESLTANNIVLAIYNHITDPMCRQYALRQAYEEALHTDVFLYVLESLSLDSDEVLDMYNSIPSIKKKDIFVIDLTKSILDKSFEIKSDTDVQKFLYDIIGYYCIMESIFFYGGFAMMLALKRQKKMVGLGQQFYFILRDESVHIAFGFDLTKTIINEYRDVWTNEFKEGVVDTIIKAVELEKEYAIDACPDGVVGINSREFLNYIEYIADKRLERLGLRKVFNTKDPFPWLSEQMDTMKESNFFETRVTEYSIGTLEW